MFAEPAIPPGPDDVAYFTQAQAGGWGQTLQAFARFAGLPVGGVVIDVGAGPGLLPRLAGQAGARLAVSYDGSAAMSAQAAELARAIEPAEAGQRVAVVTGLANRLALAGGRADLVVASNVLFLLDDPAAGLAEMARVARPGGVVAYLNPAAEMCRAAAQAFVERRGLAGFAAYSFVNYGRLAEEHHRLSQEGWLELGRRVGLAKLRTETRSDGLVVLVAGRRPDLTP